MGQKKVVNCDPCGCWNLKDGGITIGIWTLVFSATQLALFAWQSHLMNKCRDLLTQDYVCNAEICPCAGTADIYFKERLVIGEEKTAGGRRKARVNTGAKMVADPVMIYCFAEFGIFGWQTYAIYWERSKVAIMRNPNRGALDPFSARFNAYWYEMFSESEEERFFLSIFIIQVINLIVDFFLLGSSVALIIGIHKNSRHYLWPWFVSMGISILTTSLYCAFWWAMKAQSYWVVLTTIEACSVVINIYCMWCISLVYRLIKKGRVEQYLAEDKATKKHIVVYDASSGSGGGGGAKSKILEQYVVSEKPKIQEVNAVPAGGDYYGGQINTGFLPTTPPQYYTNQQQYPQQYYIQQPTIFEQQQQQQPTKIDYMPQPVQILYGPNGEQYIVAQAPDYQMSAYPQQQGQVSQFIQQQQQPAPPYDVAMTGGQQQLQQQSLLDTTFPKNDYTNVWLQGVEQAQPYLDQSGQPGITYVLPLKQEYVEKSEMPMTGTSNNNNGISTLLTSTNNRTTTDDSSRSRDRHRRHRSRSESSRTSPDRESRRSKSSHRSRSSRRQRSCSTCSSSSSTQSDTSYGGRTAVTNTSQRTSTSHRSTKSADSRASSRHRHTDDEHRHHRSLSRKHHHHHRSRDKLRYIDATETDTGLSITTTTYGTGTETDLRSRTSDNSSSRHRRSKSVDESSRRRREDKERKRKEHATPRDVKNRDRLRANGNGAPTIPLPGQQSLRSKAKSIDKLSTTITTTTATDTDTSVGGVVRPSKGPPYAGARPTPFLPPTKSGVHPLGKAVGPPVLPPPPVAPRKLPTVPQATTSSQPPPAQTIPPSVSQAKLTAATAAAPTSTQAQQPKKLLINSEITISLSDKSRSATPGSDGDKKLLNSSGTSTQLITSSSGSGGGGTTAYLSSSAGSGGPLAKTLQQQPDAISGAQTQPRRHAYDNIFTRKATAL